MRYQGRRTDGTVIDLAKDCDCIIHEGPHWLHMDTWWRRRNRAQAAQVRAAIALGPRPGWTGWAEAALASCAREEMNRLAAKVRQMETLGIEEVIVMEPQPPSADDLRVTVWLDRFNLDDAKQRETHSAHTVVINPGGCLLVLGSAGETAYNRDTWEKYQIERIEFG